MKSNVTATWKGSFKDGKGELYCENSSLQNTAYKTVFAKSTNTSTTTPEELLGSAHASCFNLTLGYILSQAGIVPELLETAVIVTLKDNTITSSELNLKARIAELDNLEFQKYALQAKEMCAIGRALNLEITLQATLL